MFAQTTWGAVLDPFSILVTGITRKFSGSKFFPQPDLNGMLHGELKFKQAFVNACHFAETMTVIGPVAQLDWGRFVDPVLDTLWWTAEQGAGDNDAFFGEVKAFLQKNVLLPGVPTMQNHIFPQTNNKIYSLPIFPDSHMYLDSTDYNDQHKAKQYIQRHLFGNGYYAEKHEVGYGSPVIALMAVVFSFKRESSVFKVTELTNLGGWPPVCFLVPVLVPAWPASSFREPRSYDEDELRRYVTGTQPSLASYQLRISAERGDAAVPYGQPYFLRSVSKWGKTSDILRSLSDVFGALWSQATQFCAWNTQWPELPGSDSENVVGNFILDPVGAGRRIRGHNRFSAKYDMHGVNFLWEENPGDRKNVVLWGNTYSRRQAAYPVHLAQRKDATMMFVAPSYLHLTENSILPTALTLMRYSSPAGELYDFIAKGAVKNTIPGRYPTLVPTAEEEFSFSSRITDKARVGSNYQGPLLVSRIPASVEFNRAGTPEVFGLQSRSVPLESPNLPDSQGVQEILTKTFRLEEFKFMDAFCSGSSAELTEVFSAAKKSGSAAKAKAKANAVSLVDDEVVVDLFGEISSEGGMI
jgi:hypothetical protein